MALTPTVLGHALSSTSATPVTTVSVTPVGGGLITVSIQSMSRSTISSAAPTITGLSGTWVSKAANPYDVSGAARARADLLVCKNYSGSGTLSIAYSGGTPDDVEYCITEWSGVDLTAGPATDGIIQAVTAAGTAANPTVTLAALASANNAALGLVGSEHTNGTIPLTPGSGFAQLAFDGQDLAAPDWLETEWAANKTVVNWTRSGTNSWGTIAAEIAASVAVVARPRPARVGPRALPALLARRRHRNASTERAPRFATATPYVRPRAKVTASRRPPLAARRRHRAQPVVLPAAPRRSLLAFVRQAILVTRRRRPPQARRHHQATLVRPAARPGALVLVRQALAVTRRVRPPALLARRRHRNATVERAPTFATPTPYVRPALTVTRRTRRPMQARRAHHQAAVVRPARTALLIQAVRQAVTVVRHQRQALAARRRHRQAIVERPSPTPLLAFFRPQITVSRKQRQATVARRRHHAAPVVVRAPRFRTATPLVKPLITIVRHARQALTSRRRHRQAELGRAQLPTTIAPFTLGQYDPPSPAGAEFGGLPGDAGYDPGSPSGGGFNGTPGGSEYDAPTPGKVRV